MNSRIDNGSDECQNCSTCTFMGWVDTSDGLFYCEDCWTDYGVSVKMLSCSICTKSKPQYEFSKSQQLKSAKRRKCKPCLLPVKESKKVNNHILQTRHGTQDFNHIHEKVLVGNLESTLAHDELIEAGVTNILSLGPEPLYEFDDFTYLHFEIEDMETEPLYRLFPEALKFIESSEGAVLVHCRQGISRSGSIAIAWMMRHNDWGFFQTLEFAQSKRSKISPNPGFINMLRAFEISGYNLVENEDCLERGFEIALRDYDVILTRYEEEFPLNKIQRLRVGADMERFKKLKVAESWIAKKKRLLQRFRKLK